MKAQILKISGHKNEKDFYKEFPTMDSFMAKHGAAFRKAQSGDQIPDWVDTGAGTTAGGANRFNLNQFGLPNQTIPNGIGYKQTDPFAKQQPFNPNQTSQTWAKNNPAVGNQLPKDIGYKANVAGQQSVDTGKAVETGIGMVDKVVGGFKALKAEKAALKSARTWKNVSDIAKKASETVDVDANTQLADNQKRLRKALMPSQTGEETFPTYGVGTNVLAKHGLPTGGLSRSEDYGSKSKPYASVSKGDFAGGGRSYPIPTVQDAGDALRLAGLHHRPDVKAKVYAKYPELRKGQNGEIMNTFAPGDIYDDGGYEPMGESDPGFSPMSDEDVIKAYRSGGLMPIAQSGFGFGNMMKYMGGSGAGAAGGGPWGAAGNAGENLASNVFGNNAGTQIGGGFGEAAGSLFGPVGGAIGKTAGALIGGAFDRNPQRTKKAQSAMMSNINTMSGMNNIKGFQSGYSGSFEDGGYLSHDWQPQVITKFGEHDVDDLLRPDKTMDTLRTGGNIRSNEVGDIEAVSGGKLEPLGYNPYSDGSGITSMIKGQTHEQSNGKHTGVLLNYNKAEDGSNEPQVEAENNEPVTEVGDDAVIFGDIVINKATVGDDPHFKPFYGKTFKKAMAGVAEQNKKLNKQQAKNTKMLNDLDPKTPIDKIKLNSLSMNEKAIDKKYQFNDMIMKKAAAHQQIVNDANEHFGTNSGEFSRNNLAPADNVARSGKMLYADAGENIKPKIPIDKVKKTRALSDYRRGQHAAGKLYGNVNQVSVDKLKEENPWYDWDTFDINKPGDVKHFQQSFNKLAQKVGSKERLNEDDQLGEQTASARIDLGEEPKTPTPPPGTTDKDGVYETSPYNKYGWENIAAQALPWFRKQPGEPLLGDQLAGEMFAMSNNQVEPVQARFYHPQLDVPYDISYQDKLNENQATFNQMQRAAGSNPEALASLAGQKYGADSNVLAEQFRANQAKKDQVYSGNRATLNQAQEKNLEIADQQYVRQAQAKSNTKAVKQEALNSIAAKVGQNRLENRTLQTYANMFPDFSYDKNYRIRKTGAPTTFNMPVVYNAAGEITHVAVYDENGKIQDYRKITPEEQKTMGKKKDETTPPPAATPPLVESKTARSGSLVKAFKNL